MAMFQAKNYGQIMQRLSRALVARSDLTDLTESSAARHLLSAFAQELDDVYFQMMQLKASQSVSTATGQDLIDLGRLLPPGTLTLGNAQSARGYVVFSRAADSATTVTIPAQTMLTRTDGQTCVTLTEAVITPGAAVQITGHTLGMDSLPVIAVASTPGAQGNAQAGAYTRFAGKAPAGVSSVQSVSTFVGGQDQEAPEVFRQRLSDYIANLPRATPSALTAAVIGLPHPDSPSWQIRYAYLYELPETPGQAILYVDDGTGHIAQTAQASETLTRITATNETEMVGGEQYLRLAHAPVDDTKAITITAQPAGGAAQVLVLGQDVQLSSASGQLYFTNPRTAGETLTATYTYFTGLIAEAQRVIDGDADDPVNYPGYRAAGVSITVRAPQVLSVVVEATILTTALADRTAALAACRSAIEDYVNSTTVGQDVIVQEISAACMAVDEVYDVNISTPTANLVSQGDQLLRIVDSNIILY